MVHSGQAGAAATCLAALYFQVKDAGYRSIGRRPISGNAIQIPAPLVLTKANERDRLHDRRKTKLSRDIRQAMVGVSRQR
jgi:hypothetical protein